MGDERSSGHLSVPPIPHAIFWGWIASGIVFVGVIIWHASAIDNNITRLENLVGELRAELKQKDDLERRCDMRIDVLDHRIAEVAQQIRR